MALTAAEEAQTRELLAQQAAILALASEEPAIISSLGATDVSLSDLTAASSLGDSDLLLVRQGTIDKSISGSIVKTSSTVPDASTTTKGIIEIATSTEVQNGTDSTRAVVTSALFAAMASIMTYFGFACSLGTNGYLKLPSILGGVIFQWGYAQAGTSGPVITLPITLAVVNYGIVLGGSAGNANGVVGYTDYANASTFRLFSSSGSPFFCWYSFGR